MDSDTNRRNSIPHECCPQETGVPKFGIFRFLVLLAIIISSTGGCHCLKRNEFQVPEIVKPAAACSTQNPTLAKAELAYGQAVARERHCDPSCVDYFFQAAINAWPDVELQLSSCGATEGRAAGIYRSALIKLIEAGQRFGRFHPSRGLQVFTENGRTLIPTSYCGFPWQPQDFDRLIPVGEYSTKNLNSRYRCCGLGVAAMAVHCRKPGESFRRKDQLFPATVLLRPVSDGHHSRAFALQLFDPRRVSSTDIAGQQVALERDITAPIAYRQSQNDRSYIEGFLQPGASKQNVGLFMIEPYQQGKIPVVFVHGLLSDPYTWANIANEMQADPELLERYQIWGFEYATGEPFLSSAAVLRRHLKQAQLELDPTGADPALSQMVLVGHSMGGLISKLQVTYSGTQLWDAVSQCPFEQIVTSPSTRTELAESFFFEPSLSVARTVFIGTPHGGSPWARRPIGRIGAKLVEESPSLQVEHEQLLRDNVGVFSREFTRRVPTSIDLLRPNSPLLAAIGNLPMDQRVPFHTLFGSGYRMLGAGDSDSVVPVSSARTANATTEKAIKAKHTKLHQQPEGISELLCILKKHLRDVPHATFPLEAPSVISLPRPQ